MRKTRTIHHEPWSTSPPPAEEDRAMTRRYTHAADAVDFDDEDAVLAEVARSLEMDGSTAA